MCAALLLNDPVAKGELWEMGASDNLGVERPGCGTDYKGDMDEISRYS